MISKSTGRNLKALSDKSGVDYYRLRMAHVGALELTTDEKQQCENAIGAFALEEKKKLKLLK